MKVTATATIRRSPLALSVVALALMAMLLSAIRPAIAEATIFSGKVSIGTATKKAPTYVNSTAVVLHSTVTSDGTSVDMMRFSNDGAFDSLDEGLQTYSNEAGWTLDAASDGTKTVWAQYLVGLDESSVVTDTVILDRSMPTGTINIGGGDEKMNRSKVKLNLTCADETSGCWKMRLSKKDGKWTGWTKYKKTVKSWGVPKSKKPVTVKVQYMDKAGNKSEVYKDTTAATSRTKTILSSPSSVSTGTGVTTDITVKWRNTKLKKWDLPIVGYQVQFKWNGTADLWTDWFADTTLKKAVFVDAVEDHTYQFRARAINSAGIKGPWSKVDKTRVN